MPEQFVEAFGSVTSGGRQAIVGLGSIAAVLVGISVLATTGNARQGLRADVLSTRRTEPGSDIGISVSARDTAGVVRVIKVDFDDRRVETRDGNAPCARPSTETFDFEHSYELPGVYTVRAVVTTGGCGAREERVTAVRTIEVKDLRR